jgi:hypothetical protein
MSPSSSTRKQNGQHRLPSPATSTASSSSSNFGGTTTTTNGVRTKMVPVYEDAPPKRDAVQRACVGLSHFMSLLFLPVPDHLSPLVASLISQDACRRNKQKVRTLFSLSTPSSQSAFPPSCHHAKTTRPSLARRRRLSEPNPILFRFASAVLRPHPLLALRLFQTALHLRDAEQEELHTTCDGAGREATEKDQVDESVGRGRSRR